MNGNNLLDTNILIYLSREELSLDQISEENSRLFISLITLMEAKGFAFQNSREEKIINDLCDVLEIIKLDDEIVNEVISMRKKNRIKLPDAIILATAKCKSLSLITHNIDDFNGIYTGLLLIDPL